MTPEQIQQSLLVARCERAQRNHRSRIGFSPIEETAATMTRAALLAAYEDDHDEMNRILADAHARGLI